jgi:hypothetical protein
MAAFHAVLSTSFLIRKWVVPFYGSYRDMQTKPEKKSSKTPTGAWGTNKRI